MTFRQGHLLLGARVRFSVEGPCTKKSVIIYSYALFSGGATRASFAQNVQNTKVMFLNTQRSIEVLFHMQRPRALSDETKGPNAPGNNMTTIPWHRRDTVWSEESVKLGNGWQVPPQNYSLTSSLPKHLPCPWCEPCLSQSPSAKQFARESFSALGRHAWVQLSMADVISMGPALVWELFPFVFLFPVLAVFRTICSILEVKTVTWTVFAEMVFSFQRLDLGFSSGWFRVCLGLVQSLSRVGLGYI